MLNVYRYIHLNEYGSFLEPDLKRMSSLCNQVLFTLYQMVYTMKTSRLLDYSLTTFFVFVKMSKQNYDAFCSRCLNLIKILFFSHFT